MSSLQSSLYSMPTGLSAAASSAALVSLRLVQETATAGGSSLKPISNLVISVPVMAICLFCVTCIRQGRQSRRDVPWLARFSMARPDPVLLLATRVSKTNTSIKVIYEGWRLSKATRENFWPFPTEHHSGARCFLQLAADIISSLPLHDAHLRENVQSIQRRFNRFVVLFLFASSSNQLGGVSKLTP